MPIKISWKLLQSYPTYFKLKFCQIQNSNISNTAYECGLYSATSKSIKFKSVVCKVNFKINEIENFIVPLTFWLTDHKSQELLLDVHKMLVWHEIMIYEMMEISGQSRWPQWPATLDLHSLRYLHIRVQQTWRILTVEFLSSTPTQ